MTIRFPLLGEEHVGAGIRVLRHASQNVQRLFEGKDYLAKNVWGWSTSRPLKIANGQ